MRRGYTDRSSSEPRGVPRGGALPEGNACNGFCTEPWASARAAVDAATQVAVGAWMDGAKAERLLGEIMRDTIHGGG